MTAGVPGAGIAGLFYLACALLAPLCNLARAWRIERARRPWSFVARLALLALAMLAGIVLAGLIIGLVLTVPSMIGHVPGAPISASTTPSFIARATVFLTLGTLIVVLAGVELLALVISPRRVAERRARRSSTTVHLSGPSS